MGRTSRTAMAALVAAIVLGGCGGTDESTPDQAQALEAGQATVDFCTAAMANVDAGAALTAFSTAGTPPRPAEELKNVLEPVRASNAKMLAAAPEMMKADIEQTAEATETKLAVFEASAGDTAAVNADPAVTEKLKAVAEPSARIRQYLRAVCRVDPN